jgi:hypothetical protein
MAQNTWTWTKCWTTKKQMNCQHKLANILSQDTLKLFVWLPRLDTIICNHRADDFQWRRTSQRLYILLLKSTPMGRHSIFGGACPPPPSMLTSPSWLAMAAGVECKKSQQHKIYYEKWHIIRILYRSIDMPTSPNICLNGWGTAHSSSSPSRVYCSWKPFEEMYQKLICEQNWKQVVIKNRRCLKSQQVQSV